MVSAIRGGDLQVLVGEASLQPPRSYGLLLHSAELIHPDGTTQDLPHLSINSEHFSLLGIFTRPFWAGSRQPAGWFELAQTLFMNVKNGERVVYDRSVLVGRRADVASVTDQVWHQAPQVQGSLSDPAATISIYRESGAPVTTVRPVADGNFSLHLPQGSYRAEVWAPGNRELELLFSVNQEGTDLGRIAVPPAAKVLLPQGHPMRLVFVAWRELQIRHLGMTVVTFRSESESFFRPCTPMTAPWRAYPGIPPSCLWPRGSTAFMQREVLNSA